MRRVKLLLLLIVTVLILSSCSRGGSRVDMLNVNSDEKDAIYLLERVIEAINNKDREAVKELFSGKALDEADDFDKNVDDLFDFIQGTIDTWEKPSGPTVFDSNDYGSKKKHVSYYYYVNTDHQQYFFLLEDYPVDTDDPDNVGLYLLLAVRAEDEEKIWDKKNKIIYDEIMENGEKKLVELSHAGIYIPIA